MSIALLTNHLAPYRIPLYERLAARLPLEVVLYGGGERYVPPWFGVLEDQVASAGFPARLLRGRREALGLARHHEIVIAPFAGGAVLPLAYAGTRRFHRRFILWASVWAEPRSPSHRLARPVTRRIYRDADAVIAYGEHVRRFVRELRGRDDDVFVAPQAVDPAVFGRVVAPEEVAGFRRRHELGAGPIVLYSGRLVEEKGVGVLLEAWARSRPEATLVLAGEGPLAAAVPRPVPGHPAAVKLPPGATVRHLGALAQAELPVAYAASALTVLPSIPTPRFREPWGLVVNEAMHQRRPVIASDAVGAVAGGLLRDGETGVVVPAGDPAALGQAIRRLLADEPLRRELGARGREAVGAHTPEAMAEAFTRAIAAARARPRR